MQPLRCQPTPRVLANGPAAGRAGDGGNGCILRPFVRKQIHRKPSMAPSLGRYRQILPLTSFTILSVPGEVDPLLPQLLRLRTMQLSIRCPRQLNASSNDHHRYKDFAVHRHIAAFRVPVRHVPVYSLGPNRSFKYKLTTNINIWDKRSFHGRLT